MTEHQKYDLIRRIGNTKVEIRRYHPCVMADVIVNSDYSHAGNIGFRPLVTYISENRIAMTAPVIQEEKSQNSWIVSFVMPDGAKLEDLPLPRDTKVTLRAIPEHTAAALIFRGYTNESTVAEHTQELISALALENLKPSGPVRIARFDPPWKPGFIRHNEVIVSI